MSELETVLEGFVQKLVRDELARLGLSGAEYSSASPPPGRSARVFNTWCRKGRVNGAVRDGAGWRCTADQWRDARSAGPARLTKPANDVDLSDAALLKAAGLRATR